VQTINQTPYRRNINAVTMDNRAVLTFVCLFLRRYLLCDRLPIVSHPFHCLPFSLLRAHSLSTGTSCAYSVLLFYAVPPPTSPICMHLGCYRTMLYSLSHSRFQSFSSHCVSLSVSFSLSFSPFFPPPSRIGVQLFEYLIVLD
jgi:hypothetical protein